MRGTSSIDFSRAGIPATSPKSGAGVIVRIVCLLMGFALVSAAFGLWLVPGVGNSADFALIKMGVSLFMLICGMCCLVFGKGGTL